MMEARNVHLDVQIFGTDIDDRAIEFARTARYQRVAGLSPERLQRWFFEDNGEFSPIRHIRSMCVFSVHNLTRDPPFSRLHLVSCRNLMIYLDADLQDRVLHTFHYALNPDGLLFLGLSEGVSAQAKLFSVRDRDAHIFQKRDDGEKALPAIPPPGQTPVPPRLNGEHSRTAGDRVERGVRAALAKHSPVFIVVDRQSNILRYSGGEIAQYLEPAAGAASLSLISNLRKSLRTVVRTALQSVMKTGDGTTVDNVAAAADGQERWLSVIVEPVPETTSEELYIVAFRETPLAARDLSRDRDGATLTAETLATEQDLRTARAQLQSTIGDLETANEEMKSAAEEYQSVNEELQSTNEELQTSKEEMQSINEELLTVNAEMMAKNDLLSNLNSDLQNLLDSTQIATIFLDDSLRIKNFTPGMADIFSLRDSDRGRPLTDIVSLLAYDDLRRDATRVLRDLTVLERELELQDRGASFIMRIRPYRSIERVIDGVVITFVDITERRKAEQAQIVSERRFTAIVNQAAVGVAETDMSGRFLLTNAAFEAMTDRSAEALRRMRRRDVIAPGDADAVIARFEQAGADGEPFEVEYRILRADGATVWVHDSVSVLGAADGRPGNLISVTLEIENRKRAEDQAGLLLGELDHRVKNILAIVSAIVAQTLRSNPSPEEFATAVGGRIMAIARAHSLLTDRGTGGGGTLRDLIETELEPFRGLDLRIEGPVVMLTPKAGLSVAMAIHELASNAAKYGSLSVPGGGLRVDWTVTDDRDRRLRINWTETGGPHVAGPPSKRGFGTTLIERSLGYEFDAKVDRKFEEGGVVCTFDLPFTSTVGELRRRGEERIR
jgi:two-component system CheB/CheR fusion protein